MAAVSMSKQEFVRLEVLLGVQSGRLRVADACALIGLRRRQVFRLQRNVKQNGAVSLLSRHRGKPSNRRLPAEVRTLALSLVRDRYPDFGPTMAAEKLAMQHGCSISRETLRGWMIADGRHRLPSPHQPRRRRAIAWANWCRSTARSTPGSRRAARCAPCWRSSTMRRAS